MYVLIHLEKIYILYNVDLPNRLGPFSKSQR